MASIFMRIDGLNSIKGAATVGILVVKKAFRPRYHDLGC